MKDTGPRSRAPLTLSTDAEHTLRNHLAIILSFSELIMQDESLPVESMADLREIHGAANAALLILDGSSEDGAV